ncbi:Na+/H+ antiporter NhaC family protein [Persicimonas caeni]|uniref:Na+/H+ antiporter NhaC family protein n=1 Tax=Persicimonas caeni TaxID=2292766 RepID=A0A4Y6PYG1_PERCE|nr:Na+/H+ antiporter NhaC family protein [Persicimonas caeni]QDG53368.1 Na+/H+ antiporter NhaC family protein [Persicimonas caeni]QED34589.1 Na+/H+ antiporter NhaC family protein [Persicimonas caeni]
MTDESQKSGAEERPESAQEATLTPRRIAGFGLAILLCLVILPFTQAAPDTQQGLTAQVVVRENTAALEKAAAEMGASEQDPVRLRFRYEGPEPGRQPVFQELQRMTNAEIVRGVAPDADGNLKVDVRYDDPNVQVRAWVEPGRAAPYDALDATKRVGGWQAVLPPLIAVLVALFFRRLIIALVAAVWVGATLQTGLNPLQGAWMAAETYVWGSVADTFSLYIIAFTFSLVGMVQVIVRMGGMQGVLDAFAWLAKSARSTQLATTAVGLAIFFDDYANTIVTGTTMRPLADEKRVSREKLAYIVDSTSAPIAGIAIISTWIGYEVGLFDVLAKQLDLQTSGYEIFFGIIPLRFYCIFALAFVVLNGLMRRDFGPMLEAERRAQKTGKVLRPGSTPLSSSAVSDMGPKKGIPHRWINAALPVGVVIAGTLLGMFWSGWAGAADPGAIPGLGDVLFGEADWAGLVAAWSTAAGDLADWSAWRDAFSNADNAKVLFWAALLGSITAIVMAVAQGLLSMGEALMSWLKAIPAMWLAVAILVLAWSIQGVCSDLGTSIYLVGAVHDLITPAMLPILTFLLASVIAFATGTSWGTMGILLPAIIPLAYYMTDGVAGGSIILMLCFGAVLDGAIFGDHCSPISDTTVMSSIASSVDHIDHVRTQFPYAATVMLVAASLGYVGVAVGLPVVLAHVLGLGALAAILFVVGKEVRPSDTAAS